MVKPRLSTGSSLGQSTDSMAARDGMLMRNEVVVVVVREKRASAEAFSITMAVRC